MNKVNRFKVGIHAIWHISHCERKSHRKASSLKNFQTLQNFQINLYEVLQKVNINYTLLCQLEVFLKLNKGFKLPLGSLKLFL